jgi:hypothetical protein
MADDSSTDEDDLSPTFGERLAFYRPKIEMALRLSPYFILAAMALTNQRGPTCPEVLIAMAPWYLSTWLTSRRVQAPEAGASPKPVREEEVIDTPDRVVWMESLRPKPTPVLVFYFTEVDGKAVCDWVQSTQPQDEVTITNLERTAEWLPEKSVV